MAKLKPGKDATKAIDQLYSLGRTFPRGRAPLDTHGRSDPDAKLPRYGGGDGLELDAKNNAQANQDPQDRHGPQYNNEPSVESWLRGGAYPPHFDHSKPRR